MALTQVKQSELQQWIDKFKKTVYPSVKFLKEPIDESGEEVKAPEQNPETEGFENTMQLYNGNSGIDASWYGKILLEEDNYVYFELSLTKKPFIKAVMSLDESNADIIKNLYLFYGDWKDYWSQTLSGNSPASGNSADMVSEIRKNRTSKFIIENYSERMRKLAGVREKKRL